MGNETLYRRVRYALFAAIPLLVVLILLGDRVNSWIPVVLSCIVGALAVVLVITRRSAPAGRRLGLVAAIVLLISLIVVSVVAYLLMNREPESVSQDETEQTNFSSISGQLRADTRIIHQEFVSGTCIQLGGTRTDAKVAKVGCGSDENNFVVVQQAVTPNQCVGDVDQKYYSNTDAKGEWTLCLDYAWVQSSCLSMNGFDVQPVKCDDKAKPQREKPVRLIENSTSVSDCPAGGYAHPVRRFTVCTETQK